VCLVIVLACVHFHDAFLTTSRCNLKFKLMAINFNIWFYTGNNFVNFYIFSSLSATHVFDVISVTCFVNTCGTLSMCKNHFLFMGILSLYYHSCMVRNCSGSVTAALQSTDVELLAAAGKMKTLTSMVQQLPLKLLMTALAAAVPV